jgi:hypothetical protein
MAKKVLPIRYTSRSFDTIKSDLINYAKKYYPDTFQDFNQGSFGSLMFDTVSYVGDIMSYYLDYQANESFLDTAIEYNNVIKLGGGAGYRQKPLASSNGVVTMYISVPANAQGSAPNEDYLPIIRQGTIFRSRNGNNFTLVEDVVVTTQNSEIRRSRVGETGPFEFVIKTFGKVVSGVTETVDIDLGDFIKFRKILVGDQNVSEILSITDSNGNIYYEVEHLSQDIVYKSIPNFNTDYKETPNILKPINVARRFIVLRDSTQTFVQFGAVADDILNANNSRIADPSSVILESYGRNYITDQSFDPTILVNDDKMGAGPYNTTLTITYRRNEDTNISAPVASIDGVILPIIDFISNTNNQDNSIRLAMEESLTVTNSQPIVGENVPLTSEEIKQKIYSAAATQGRAVTAEDYKSLSYNMPGKFGNIKRANVIRDTNTFNRNINVYVISSDQNNNFQQASTTTKENLKNWLGKNKVITDTIDILDAKIVNFGIYFTAIADQNYSKYDVLASALQALADEFSLKLDIGESIQINRIYSALRRVDGLLDVREVRLTRKDRSVGQAYSQYTYNFDSNLTPDGLFLKVPKNVVMEIKAPETDIEGKIL